MQGSRPVPYIPDQSYFNIGEASRITQTPQHTLRYWETEFNLLRPVRRESGHRRYTRRHLELIFQIKTLLQDEKMTLAGAKKALASRRPGLPEGRKPKERAKSGRCASSGTSSERSSTSF